MVVRVVDNVEEAEDAEDAEDAAELAAEDPATEETELTTDDVEDATELAAAEEAADDPTDEDLTAPVEEAADTEIKLPPLLNNVTVAGCPLITTVETVMVLCGPLPCPVLLPTLVCTVVLVV
jgi:hypothetical protein